MPDDAESRLLARKVKLGIAVCSILCGVGGPFGSGLLLLAGAGFFLVQMTGILPPWYNHPYTSRDVDEMREGARFMFGKCALLGAVLLIIGYFWSWGGLSGCPWRGMVLSSLR